MVAGKPGLVVGQRLGQHDAQAGLKANKEEGVSTREIASRLDIDRETARVNVAAWSLRRGTEAPSGPKGLDGTLGSSPESPNGLSGGRSREIAAEMFGVGHMQIGRARRSARSEQSSVLPASAQRSSPRP